RLVDEVLALTGGEACEKGVEIAALVMDSVPAAVVGDPLRLRQKGVEIAALVMDSAPAAVVGDPLRLRQGGVREGRGLGAMPAAVVGDPLRLLILAL
ncbi:unnamed protein product, partial [Closterium sp. Naga37s-1]